MNVVEFLQHLDKSAYKGRRILLADIIDLNLIRKIMQYKIDGAFTIHAGLADAFFCLHEVIHQRKYISNKISLLLDGSGETLGIKTESVSCLTDREKQIMLLIAEGYTNKQIGAKLFLSAYTISNHRTRISKKLQLKGSNQLITYALSVKSIIIKEQSDAL